MPKLLKTASVMVCTLLMAGAMGAGVNTASAQAIKDCGEPPYDAPVIPSADEADAKAIRAARDAVLAYSNQVDAYLECMDGRAAVLFTYMTEIQQTRFNNDLAAVHDGRRALQIKMNEAIRAYRDRSSKG